MTAKELKSSIQEKFGSLSRFARITGEDRYEMQKNLDRVIPDQKELNRLERLYSRTNDKATETELSEKVRKAIASAIDEVGVSDFCDMHPGFNKRYLYRVMNGDIKKKTLNILELLKILEIDG